MKDLTEKEKAESFLNSYLSEIQKGNRNATDLADWLTQSLPPEAIERLAKDWEDSQSK